MHRCSLLCLAVAQTVSSPAGSLYDSSIGLQRFPSEEVCPWQHTVKPQRGNFRVKMPDWVFDSFQPLTDVFNGVHSLPFTQPQQMESAVMLLLCLATSLFLFSPSFFPSRFLCFISWPVLRRDHYIILVPSNEVLSEKWAYIMKNWLHSFEIKEFDIVEL